jgi:hypothetical protein
MADEYLVTVDTPDFTASIVMLDDGCVRAAPVLKWCLGKTRAHLSADFRSKGWKTKIVRPCPAAPVLGGG